ncbi:ornithine decarboxylase 1-like isoform 2-T2 [Cochliomyia hominivorax]
MIIWNKLMPHIKPYYAVKCNNEKFILQTLINLGANFDCASKNEIQQILEMGADPERIIFANPCKPVSHLKYAKENNVNVVTVDTKFELYKIYETFPESELVIRFRADDKEAQVPLGEKFGCDAEFEAPALMLLAKKLNLKVIGTSFHVGSGCNDFYAYDRAITIAKRLYKLGISLGYEMNLVDIGGGFPGSDDTKFALIAEVIRNSIRRNFPDNNVEVIAEPGRYFVASAYTLICKIHAKREVISPKRKLLTKMYYINDGVYGSFNSIIYNHEVITAHHFLDGNLPTFNTVIWGPTCAASDKIIENFQLPDLNCNDFLAFPNLGAYTIPISSPFNGFGLPKILYFQKENIISV